MQTWDQFFTPPLLEVIRDQIKHLNYEPHGSGDINSPNNFLYSGELISIRFWQYLFDKIVTKAPIKERKAMRCYVNKYPPKTFSDWHRDNRDGKVTKTLIFYPDNEGASTIFERKKIEYKQNRLLYFNAGLLHKTNINDTNKDRHTLVFKLDV